MSSKQEVPLPESFNLPPVGVETHAHLDFPDFAEDLDQVVARARAAGVVWLGNIFLSVEAYRKHQPRLSAIQGMFFTLGVHPHDASTLDEASLADMAVLFARDGRLCAVGEIGLDYHYDFAPLDVQREVFAAQLALARRRDLPVIVHAR